MRKSTPSNLPRYGANQRKRHQRLTQSVFLKQYGVSTAEALVTKIMNGELKVIVKERQSKK